MTTRCFLFVCTLFVGVFVLKGMACASEQFGEQEPLAPRAQLTHFNKIHVQDCLRLGLVSRQDGGCYTIKSGSMELPWEREETLSLQGARFTIKRVGNPEGNCSWEDYIPGYQRLLNQYCRQFSKANERPVVKTSEGPLTGEILTSEAAYLLVDGEVSPALQSHLRPYGSGFAIFPPEGCRSVLQRIEIYPKKLDNEEGKAFSGWLMGTVNFETNFFDLTLRSGYFSVTFAPDALQGGLEGRTSIQGMYFAKPLSHYTVEFFYQEALQLRNAKIDRMAIEHFDVVARSSDKILTPKAILNIGCAAHRLEDNDSAAGAFARVIEMIEAMNPIPEELKECLEKAQRNLGRIYGVSFSKRG